MAEVIRLMCEHNGAGIREYVRRQQPPAWALIASRCQAAHDIVYRRMLSDVEAFMASKWPDPLPPVPKERIRHALEAPNLETDESWFEGAHLDDLFSLMSLLSRLKQAADAACAGATQTTVVEASRDVQGTLF